MVSFLEIPMNSDAKKNDLDLTAFACRFFKARGAILEPEEDFIQVLLPMDLARALAVEELITVISGKKDPGPFETKNHYTVQFQSPLLERITAMAESEPPLLHAELKFDYIKTQGFDRLIAEQFDPYKTKISVKGTAETRTRYLVLTNQYRVRSDELKEGLFSLCFNLDTGALVEDMLEPLSLVQKDYRKKDIWTCTQKEIEMIYDLVDRYGQKHLEEELSSFVQSMNRRFKRDVLSLEEYYTELSKEMKAGLSRTGLSERLIQEREEKIAMIPKELLSKKKDLLNKYSIKIDFKPVAALSISTPCVKVIAELMSGRQKNTLSLIYNPVNKRMDPLVCLSCGMSSYSLGCCDHMHLNCAHCLAKGCALCGKPGSQGQQHKKEYKLMKK